MGFRDQSKSVTHSAPSHTLASDYVLPLSPVQGQNNVLNIFDIFSLVLRQVKWLALGCVLAVFAGLAYLALSEPAYRASTLLLIDPRERAPIGVEGQNLPQNPDPYLVESQLLLIKSAPVLERVIREFDMQNDPKAKPGALRVILNLVKGLLIAPVDMSEDARVAELVASFEKEIKIKRPDRTYTLEIQIKSDSPETAVKISDALVRSYFIEQQDISDRSFSVRANWVDERIALFGKRLSVAEQAIQDYRVENGLLDTAGGPLAHQQLDETAKELATARAATNIAKARWTQVNALVKSGRGFEALNRDIRSPLFDRLVSDLASLEQQRTTIGNTFGPLHPNSLSINEEIATKRGQVGNELRAIAASVRVNFESAEAVEKNVDAQLAQLRAKTLGVNQNSLKLRDLERDAAAAQRNYQKYLSAKDNLRKDIVEAPFVSVISPAASSPNPVSPKLIPTMIIALAAGLNIGIVIAVCVDFFSRHKQAARSVAPAVSGHVSRPTRHRFVTPPRGHSGSFTLELPEFLGSRPSRDELDFVLDLISDPEQIGWQVQELRDEIEQNLQEHDEQSVFLTSSVKRTGKTFTALMLARAAAEKGENVCLYDANYDNPTLSHLGEIAGLPVLLNVDGARVPAYRLLISGAEGLIYILPNIVDPSALGDSSVQADDVSIDLFVVDGPCAEKLADMENLSDMSEGFVLVEPGQDYSKEGVRPLVDVLDHQARYLGVALSPT